jgi:PAS domain S-box-containing protein
MNQIFAGILVILGGISSYIVWNSERTERRRTQAEMALQESENLLSSIFNSTFQFISILDNKGQLLKVNQTALDFIGLEHDAVANKFFWETPWWTGTRESQILIKEAILSAQKGEFVRFEAENFGRRGRVIIVDVSLKPLFDTKDEIFRILVEGRDVTDRVLAESALEESEKRFAEFMAHLPAIAFMKDRFGRYIYTNNAFEAQVGLRSGTRIGKSDYELFSPDIAKRFSENDRKVFESGTTSEFIENVVSIEGDEKTYLSIKFPILDRKQISAIGGVSVDITDRINTEIELRQLRNLLQNIIDSMPSMLIGIDKSMNITHWNLEAERITGVLAEKAIGQPLGKIYPLIHSKMGIIQEAIAHKTSLKNVRMVVNIDKQIHHMELAAFPLIANGIEGTVIRIDDINERVQLEEMMIQSEKMLTVGGLAAGMAHEINNPLAGILQNVQVLRNRISLGLPKNQVVAEDLGLDFEKLQAYLHQRGIYEMLEAISDSGQRAAQIVDNMLSFSRKSESKLAPHDLADLLDRTVSLAAKDYDLKKKYDFKRIKIIREYDPATPKVPCEGSKIQQVILNLLKNSAHAIAENIEAGREPAIILRVFKDDIWVRMEIEDNGPGMDERTRKRIFEPFFTTKEVGVGTGLGLSVSYFIIVDNHHGEIQVESEQGKGAKFIIRLPIEVE